MSEQEQMKQLADNLAPYIWKSYIEPKLTDLLHFCKATIYSAPADGKVKITKPFEANPIEVNCIGSASGMTAGSPCLVVSFGSASNSFVVGDTLLTNL